MVNNKKLNIIGILLVATFIFSSLSVLAYDQYIDAYYDIGVEYNSKRTLTCDDVRMSIGGVISNIREGDGYYYEEGDIYFGNNEGNVVFHIGFVEDDYLVTMKDSCDNERVYNLVIKEFPITTGTITDKTLNVGEVVIIDLDDYHQHMPFWFHEPYYETRYQARINGNNNMIVEMGQNVNWGDYEVSLNPNGELRIKSFDEATIDIEIMASNNRGIIPFWDSEAHSFQVTMSEPLISHPTILTRDPFNIGFESAVFRGELLTLGDYADVDVAFQYREDGSSEWTRVGETNVDSTGIYTLDVTDLDPETTYHYHFAYYHSEQEDWVSDIHYATFTTEAEPEANEPNIINLPFEDITEGGFKLIMNIEDLGTYDNVSVKFACKEYEKSGSYIDLEGSNDTLDSTGNYSFNANGLYPSTLYSCLAVYYSTIENDWVQVTPPKTNSTISGWYNTSKVNKTTTGIFDLTLTDLKYLTEYEFRACGEDNESNVVCGEVMYFNTTYSAGEVDIIDFIDDQTLTQSDELQINISDYFENYETFYFISDGIIILDYYDDYTYTDDSLNPILKVEPITTGFKINSYTIEENYFVELGACNPLGCEQLTFYINIEGEPDETESDEEVSLDLPPEIQETAYGGLIQKFLDLFPDPDDLTTMQKIAFVTISLIILTALLFAIAHSQTGGIPTSVLYITLFLNILLFIFFAVVGYVPTGIIIILCLIAIGLGLLRYWGNRGSGGE